jgi:hypothetical protein
LVSASFEMAAQMPEPSEVRKRSLAEALSPVGWRRALEEVIAETRRKRQKAQSLLLAAMAAITLVVTLFFVSLKLLDILSR